MRRFLAAAQRPFSPSPRAAAAEDAWRHGLSLMGEPKYPAGFTQFDYVNPDAPKGGLVRLGVQDTFDNFNLFVSGVKGALEAASRSSTTR